MFGSKQNYRVSRRFCHIFKNILDENVEKEKLCVLVIFVIFSGGFVTSLDDFVISHLSNSEIRQFD